MLFIDGRISDVYLRSLSFPLLALLLPVLRRRIKTLRRPLPYYRQASLCARLPHLVCCLLLVMEAVVIIAADAVLVDQDVLSAQNTTNAPAIRAETSALYTAALCADAAMWALCAALVLAEQRRGKHTCRTLRLWWLLHVFVAALRLEGDVVRVVDWRTTLAAHDWTLFRLCSFAPSLVLGLIALFAPDSPSADDDDDDDDENGPAAGGGINARGATATSTAMANGAAAAPLLDHTTSAHSGGPPMPPPSTEARASFASKLTFSYMSPLLSLGRRKHLDHIDLHDLDYGDTSLGAGRRFERSLSKGGSFLRCWHRAFGVYFWLTGAMQLLNTTCTFANPILLHTIVSYVEGRLALSTPAAVSLAIAMFAANSLKSLILGQYFWRGFRCGLRTKSAVTQVVYAKALALAHEGRQEFGVGALVSYMQIDASKLADAIPYLHLLWQGPLQLGVATYMLYIYLGPAGFAGLGVMIISMPLNTWMGKASARFTKRTMQARDKRVKFANELLQGVKILKLFAWEPSFISQLDEKRKGELKCLRNSMMLGGLTSFVFTALPLVVTVVTFAVYAALGNAMTAAKAYTALSLFQIVRFPLLVVPMLITRSMDIVVVNGRLTRFLRYPSRPLKLLSEAVPAVGLGLGALPGGYYVDPKPAQEGECAVEFRAATFKWPEPKPDDKKKRGAKGKSGGGGKDGRGKNGGRGKGNGTAAAAAAAGTQPLVAAAAAADGNASSVASSADGADAAPKPVLPPTLTEISLRAKRGSLVGIAGPVGSGKSTLLSAAVGDVPRLVGSVIVRGSVALCTQEPWIQNCSLRENILFGLAYDGAKYKHVLRACALEADLEVLPAGDLTEIGERGVNLSGGQKARVALARACYSRADVILLDDVLSAVDAEVGAHLIGECVCGLLRDHGATTLLVSHHTQHFKCCDHVIQLNENGTIKAQGTPESLEGLDLSRSGSSGRLSAAASSTNLAASAESSSASSSASSHHPRAPAKAEVGGGAAGAAAAAAAGPGGGGGGGGGGASAPVASPTSKINAKKAKTMADEDREKGSVELKVWMRYVSALGRCTVFVGIIGMILLSQALTYGSSYWLGIWSEDKFPRLSGGKPWFYLDVYSGAAIFSAFCIMSRSLITAFASLRASRTIHHSALQATVYSPMRFFDTTPTGRILNRFSGDVQKVDTQLASSGTAFLSSTVMLLCTLVILALVSPYILAALPVLAFLYVRYASYYRNTAREVQRLDSISRSPIYSAFSEALNGATSIQAYGANTRFEAANSAKVDYNMRATYISLATNRWLAIRLEFFSNLLVALAALLAVIQAVIHGHGSAATRATAAGLALTYAPGLTDTLNQLIRQFTQLETQMVSVERLLNYATLPGETTDAPQAVPASWPHAGAIELSSVRMRYRDGLPDVLRGCDLSVRGGEKIGIVGRTGAGKSSILVALYRLADIHAGSITIDGVDTSRVPLPELRSRLSIIPQDPIMFTGTLRINIDPTSKHSDETLWRVLEQCGMDAAMREHPLGLARPIEERGGNLSMGQRQLLCLARALLRSSRILVLDEATASVDKDSDALIQRTLQGELGGTTTLTIAHRLETIMHCDRIVVMHEGVVDEQGPPHVLKESGGRFAELWESQS